MISPLLSLLMLIPVLLLFVLLWFIEMTYLLITLFYFKVQSLAFVVFIFINFEGLSVSRNIVVRYVTFLMRFVDFSARTKEN